MNKVKIIDNYKKYQGVIDFVVIFLLSFALYIFPHQDADLGWHLRYGEYFLKNGKILMENTFSQPLYGLVAFINHSWFYDVIIAWLWKHGQFIALSITGAVVIAASIAVITIRLNGLMQKFFGLGLIYIFTMPLLSLGFKSAILSVFFTVLLWDIVVRFFKTENIKWLYHLPLLFILWANLHGQFLLGLGLLMIYLIYAIKFFDKTKKKHVIIAVVLSFAASIVNPYGWQLHATSFLHLGSPLLTYIQEWHPWPLFSWRMILLYIYSSFFWWQVFKTKDWKNPEVWMLTALNILALKSRRIIVLYILLSLPLWMMYFVKMINKEKRKLIFNWLGGLSGGLLMIWGAMNLFLSPAWAQTWDTYCNSEIQCSEGVVKFLKENKIKGNIFNAYRIGGHLEYRYPENRMFIDGRMVLWEGQYQYRPFEHYYLMVHGLEGGKELFYAYDFDYVILNHQYKLVNILKEYEGWKEIYTDDKVVVLEKPEKKPEVEIPQGNEVSGK